MNNTATECPRCTGEDGAHFAFCFIAQLWDRLLGPNYPWAPQLPEDDIPLPEEPPDWSWDDFRPGAGPVLDPDWEALDPPDHEGVAEDTAVVMGAPSDSDWLPHGMWIAPDTAELDDWHAERQLHAVTDLPDDYYDQYVVTPPVKPTRTGPTTESPAAREATKPPRRYNTGPMREAHDAMLKAQEDAAVVFVYDCCDLDVPGGRVPLADLHDRYVGWQKANDMPSMSKERLRSLLTEIGVVVEPGRLPGMRTAGRAPLLVNGLLLKQPEPEVKPEPQLPKVVVRAKPERHALIGAKPGGELPKQVRELIEPLITEQRWEYQPHGGSGKGRPRVKSPTGKVCTLPSTPHLQGHTLENTRSFLKQNGAVL